MYHKIKNIILILFLIFSSSLYPQTKLLSWNIENLGKSKSAAAITFMAQTMKNYDIIAIQEVVAGYGGSPAVATLAAELNTTGAKWDYTISNPTSSSAYKTERYAYIWKTKSVTKIGRAWLEKKYNLQIDREPYYCTFEYKSKQFTVVNFHAITKSKQPETEIKYFKFLPAQYPTLNLIFAGDFNCPQSHTVFNPLKKMGYQSILVNQKTSLKKKYSINECLASEFDNVFYDPRKVNHLQSGVIPFYKKFNTLQEARKISDHLPIWFEFSLN